jgi:hypothetical protein
MIETVVIVVSVLSGLGAAGTAGYKCYKTYKERREPTVVIQQNLRDGRQFRGDMIDEIVANQIAKKRKSGDSDTTVDIKINIHTHEEGSE